MNKTQKYPRRNIHCIELWKESGLSQQRYCHQNSIALNTFRYWVKKYHNGKKPAKFIFSSKRINVFQYAWDMRTSVQDVSFTTCYKRQLSHLFPENDYKSKYKKLAKPLPAFFTFKKIRHL